MAERLPPGFYESGEMRPVYLPNGNEPHSADQSSLNGEHQHRTESDGPYTPLSMAINSSHTNGISTQNFASANTHENNRLSAICQNRGIVDSHVTEEEERLNMGVIEI